MTVKKVKGAGEHRPESDGTPHPRRPLARIVERVFAVEVRVEDYERLERELALSDVDQTRPEAIRSALNRVQQNASLAHRLFIAARVEFELFETECTRYLAPMFEEATKALIADGSMKGKSITDKAVEARMNGMFGDQVLIEQERRAKAKSTLEHLRRLADLWRERAFALGQMK